MTESHTFQRFHCADLIVRDIFPSYGCCDSCHEDVEVHDLYLHWIELACGCVIDYCCRRQARIAKLTNDEEKERALMDKLHAPLVE